MAFGDSFAFALGDVSDLVPIEIDQVSPGETVRVSFSMFRNSRGNNLIPDLRGIFKITPDGESKSLNIQEFKRLNFNKRKFLARVVVNNSNDREITLVVEDSRSRGKVYYQLVVPYTEIRRMARLIKAALDLTPAEEDKRRRNSPRDASRYYFHPNDKFVSVIIK